MTDGRNRVVTRELGQDVLGGLLGVQFPCSPQPLSAPISGLPCFSSTFSFFCVCVVVTGCYVVKKNLERDRKDEGEKEIEMDSEKGKQ